MTEITDHDRLDFLQQAAMRSNTGVSIDWVPSVEGGKSGFRLMTRHNIRQPHSSIRAAIDAELKAPRSR